MLFTDADMAVHQSHPEATRQFTNLQNQSSCCPGPQLVGAAALTQAAEPRRAPATLPGGGRSA